MQTKGVMRKETKFGVAHHYVVTQKIKVRSYFFNLLTVNDVTAQMMSSKWLL